MRACCSRLSVHCCAIWEVARDVLSGGDDGRVERLHYHFGAVLLLILSSLVLGLAAPDEDIWLMAVVVLQGATLIAAVVASRAHEWVIRLTIAAATLLMVAALGAVIGTEDLGGDSARLISFLMVALAPPAIVAGVRRQFLAEQRITMQTMFGVLCLYLLLGLLFAAAYGTIQDVFGGGDFFVATAGDSSDFLYFSFATLTTVGYGDLIAATDVGRSLAITEALVGQIYLVTVVALIVGNLRAAPRSPRRSP